jgi:UDP-N-acetylmuramate: L-alanyl-gamma-D-glutamyl-meso-diaminopimelate ligase
VVAGTHGKTTTTALTAWLLEAAGRDPGFLIGGVASNFDRTARRGGGGLWLPAAARFHHATACASSFGALLLPSRRQ